MPTTGRSSSGRTTRRPSSTSGEAYVKMGKLDDARAVLGRLEPLDKKEAAELRAAIDKAKK